jgi:hypothetical protein
LDAVAQARERKRRQRERLAKQAVVKVEVMLPAELQKRVKTAAAGKSLSAIGEEAFRLWVSTR